MTTSSSAPLIEQLRAIVGAQHVRARHGHVGVPAIFPSWCFSELSQLRGDQGARAILQRNASRLVHVAMPTAALDLDTPEDLERVRESIEKG